MTEQERMIAAQVAKAVQDRLQTLMQVTTETVSKNNGINLTSITGQNDGLGTNVYIDHDIWMIQNGQTTVEDVAARVAETLQRQAQEAPFTSEGVQQMFDNPDTSKIMAKVISHDQNIDMLQTTPHRDIHGDLAIIGVYKINDEASAVISGGLAAKMGMTSNEVIDHAIRNAQHQEHSVQGMAEVLAASMGMDPEQAAAMFGADETMLVVSNADKKYGATDIFIDKNLREQVAEKFGAEDFYILPSSIHEVICVRADSMSPEQAATMIREVNTNEVRPEEVLSNHPYLVNAETLKISNPCQEQAERVADSFRHSAHM